jgi:hypothetical protein
VTLLVRAMGDLNQLEETTVVSLIRVLRDLGRRAGSVAHDPRRRPSHTTVRDRTRAAPRLWRPMW